MRAFVDTEGGLQLRSEIDGDPRLSESQVAAIKKLWRSDPKAEVLGLDEKHRPVVRCKLHSGTRQYALMRDGAPTTKTGKLTEVWHDRRR